MTTSLAEPMIVACAGTIGAVGGWAYFAALNRSVKLGSARQLLLTLLIRLAGAAVGFWIAAQFGPWPLLAAFAGFLVGRWLMMRAARRAA